jgi:hypothetical protein
MEPVSPADCKLAAGPLKGVQDIHLGLPLEHHHHFAEAILIAYPEIQTDVTTCIKDVRNVEFGSTPGGRFGIGTDGNLGLNIAIRQILVAKGKWRSEVGWTDRFSRTLWLYDPADRLRTGTTADEKFDLALLDECLNASRVWNQFSDYKRVPEQDLAILKQYARQHVGSHWSHCLAERLRPLMGREAPEPVTSGSWDSQSLRKMMDFEGLLPLLPETPTLPFGSVVGEIQFGNWALAYRDIGRMLAVRNKFAPTPISLFVVLVATGCLRNSISAGTVNFDQFRIALERVGNDLPVPTWLIGMDFDHSGRFTHPSP